MKPRIALFLLFLFLALSSLAEPVSTILVQGLRNVEREVLLADLGIHEGQECPEDVVPLLKERGRGLPYLQSLEVSLHRSRQGVHLTLLCRETRAIRFQPILQALEDGELTGGFLLGTYSLLGHNENIDFRILAGSRGEVGIRMKNFRILRDPRLPLLLFDYRYRDWEDPFLQAGIRSIRILGGASRNFPGLGRIEFSGGWERIESSPAVGLESLNGKDEHALYRLKLSSTELAFGIKGRLNSELRVPLEHASYSRAEALLEKTSKWGAWNLRFRLRGGLASKNSPALGIFHLSSWKYFHAYEPASLPSQQFWGLSARSTIHLTDLPIRFQRRGAGIDSPLDLFLESRFMRRRSSCLLPWEFAMEAGLGLRLTLPTGQMVSLASYLHHGGEDLRFLILLEDSVF